MNSNKPTQIHQEIFTDGSKSSNKVLAAAVFLKSILSFSTNLLTMSSIFTAELTAIKIALSNIHKKNTNSISSLPTLKSALQSIIHKNLSNPITEDILYNHHYNIIFCWIPSHDGIKGNTKADKLAHVTPISSTQVIPIPPSDALHTLWNYIRTKWQATWDSFPKDNKLYKIFPELQHFPPLHHSYSRKNKL